MSILNEFASQVVDILKGAASSLGPQLASLEKKDLGASSDDWLELRLKPANPRSAQIVVVLVTRIYFYVANCHLELEDLMEGSDTTPAIEAAGRIVDEVVAGRYSEKLQRLPGFGVVAAEGTIQLERHPLKFGHGIFLPFLKSDLKPYEPYGA